MSYVVDASAILAVLLEEPEAEEFTRKLLAAGEAWMSPVNYWEARVRAQTMRGLEGSQKVESICRGWRIRIAETTAHQADLAFEAFTRYKGRPAKLNLGDCFAYALARSKKLPLLYTGGDFDHTDVLRP